MPRVEVTSPKVRVRNSELDLVVGLGWDSCVRIREEFRFGSVRFDSVRARVRVNPVVDLPSVPLQHPSLIALSPTESRSTW